MLSIDCLLKSAAELGTGKIRMIKLQILRCHHLLVQSLIVNMPILGNGLLITLVDLLEVVLVQQNTQTWCILDNNFVLIEDAVDLVTLF